MKATVFYVELTDDQVKDLNSNGWGSDIGRAYMSAKDGRITEDNRRLFRRAADLDAKENEEVWRRLQNGMHNHGVWRADPDIACRTGFPRSMDVGDLIFWEDGRIERCAAMGFEPVAPEGPVMTLA